MNAKTDAAVANQFDVIKWLVAGLLVGLALAGFYYFSESSLLLRVFILLAAFGVAVYIALQTAKGRSIWSFGQESHLEVRKVVWPTRQETMQMTGVVILMVVVMALMIWGIDSILLLLVRSVTG